MPDLLSQPPLLDPTFLPAVLWNRDYRQQVEANPRSRDLHLSLSRPGGTAFHHQLRILPHEGANIALNKTSVERTLKFLLWSRSGSRIHIAGNDDLAAMLATLYAPDGAQAFDSETIGTGMFGEPIQIIPCKVDELPPTNGSSTALGRHLDGCRIGFDLGGSDRKAAAVIDGEVVFSEEISWDPYFQSDPQYHLDGIRDTLTRAAAHLPRVDAIGGSAAGIYIKNEVRVASLFRGITDPAVYDEKVRPIFRNLRKEWNNVPFDVINDGEVTALAGSMSMNANSLLGISMGTSQAVGYCDAHGHISPWLNELAFAPIDYREDAPLDEWSKDRGCGVQYFSQQGVARLAKPAGFDFGGMPFPEQLVEVQNAMQAGDDRARKIYLTIGTCFGYAIAHYAEFYDIQNLLILGRVTSGAGGDLILEESANLLKSEFPQLAEQLTMSTPDEQMKRHGQAVAAASLPVLP